MKVTRGEDDFFPLALVIQSFRLLAPPSAPLIQVMAILIVSMARRVAALEQQRDDV